MKKSPTQRLIHFSVMAVLVMLVLLLVPIAVRAEAPAKLSANERSEGEVDELVEQMLSAGDYVEGDAIVCYMPADGNEITVQASDLLANAEYLSGVTSQQYAEATGEALPATEKGILTTQSADTTVEIVFVHSDDASTEQLLRELLEDSQVLSAEPNYLVSFAKEGSDDTATEEPSAAIPMAEPEKAPAAPPTDAIA